MGRFVSLGVEKIRLIKPIAPLAEEYTQMLAEWKASDERLVPFSLTYDSRDFEKYIALLNDFAQGRNLTAGFVPCTTFWLVNEAQRILGTLDIRHRLTDFLILEGGHIGYGVRPSERKKGYATKMLGLALPEAKKLHIEKILLTCDADNMASRKTIETNGGAFYKENMLNGKKKLSFWINLK